MKIMAHHDIGSLVVMDHGKMAGMLTFAEVLRALAERGGSSATLMVADIYEREPLTAARSRCHELRGRCSSATRATSR